MIERGAISELTLSPIGVIHTPFRDRHSAPRQPAAARGVAGTIELAPGSHYEHALSDLSGFTHLWVIFWFHLNETWNPKVAPPRSAEKRGVFATRSPHRPNPLGLSVLRLLRIEGLTLHVLDVDMIDGTPVFDLKPYVPYTDAVPEAGSGWLNDAPVDPGPRYHVVFETRAREQLDWLALHTPLPLEQLAREVLELGPAPHPYRRIRALGDHLRLAVKDFRLRFRVEGQTVHVVDLATGYRKRVLGDPRALATAETPLSVHRAFVSRFGESAIY